MSFCFSFVCMRVCVYKIKLFFLEDEGKNFMQTQMTKLRLSKMREAGKLNKVAIMKMDRLRGFIGKRERQRYLRH